MPSTGSMNPHRLPPLAAALLGGALLGGCGGGAGEPPPPPPGAIGPGQSIGSASIAGRVLFRGTPPERRTLKMSGEPACAKSGATALSEEVIVNPDGSLRNVYVHVVSGLGERVFAPPREPAEMDQRGCIFVPHVLSVQTDQLIVFKSSDPVVHNVRAVTGRNRAFNVSMSGHGRTVRRFFPEPEVVGIRCDIHAWMSAWIAVSDNPFHAVTGESGRFELRGLPAGTYEVEAWHERFGSVRRSVTVAQGEKREIEIAFGG
ncbi:MAG: carboxypeptidase regulatory-like domain-containing protein [Acidobacteriota bacterium]